MSKIYRTGITASESLFEKSRYYTFRSADAVKEFIERYPQHNKFLYNVLNKGFKVLTVNVMGTVHLVETHEYKGASIVLSSSERKYFKRITKKQFEEMRPAKEESLEDLINLFAKSSLVSLTLEDFSFDNQLYFKNSDDLKDFLIENKPKLENYIKGEIKRMEYQAKYSSDKVAELKEIQKSL